MAARLPSQYEKKSIRLLLYYSLHPSAYMLTLWQRIERVAQLARYVGGAVAKIFK